jgi:ribosomal protein L3 glutamine methyltransferase
VSKALTLPPEALESAIQDLGTLRDFVRWGASRFNEAGLCFGHGFDNAIDEALALVLHALHLEPDIASDWFSSRLIKDEKRAVVELFAHRVNERCPVAYLVCQAWFAGLSFFVDKRVLIPRSPIAEWIERCFLPWSGAVKVRRILDLGTGSGCIAIACALAFPEAEVHAVDVSAAALDVAQENIAAHGVEDRVHGFRSDLFASVRGPYDLIVSNPPYVDAQALAELPAEYRHEPRSALEGGEDGLFYLRQILEHAKSHLTPQGMLIVEVGVSRPALEDAFPKLPFTWLEIERGGDNVLFLTAEQLEGGLLSSRPVSQGSTQ